MKRIFWAGVLALGLLSFPVFAQMNSGQGGGMMEGGRMGGGWGWGMGYGWGFGTIVVILVVVVVAFMMRRK